MRKINSTNTINEKYLFASCEVNSALSVISGRWKVQILLSIYNGNDRFYLLKKDLANISEQVLSRQLKDLVKNGLITKMTIPDTIPIGIEYSLSDKTLTLLPILDQLCAWGKNWD